MSEPPRGLLTAPGEQARVDFARIAEKSHGGVVFEMPVIRANDELCRVLPESSGQPRTC